MTTLQSSIKFGQRYRDSRTGIEGYATALYFNEHGCVEVCVEAVKDKEVKNHFFPQERLIRLLSDGTQITDDPPMTFETEIEFGREYYDTQTGISGWPAVLEFHEYIANRVSLRSAGEDREGNPKLIYHNIDDFLLAPVEGGSAAKRQDEKPSPVTRQVERR